MKRDPFDHLREINPLPQDQPVYPPMATADRIAGGPARPSWPAWALAGGLALAVLIGGGGWLLWTRGGDREIASTSVPPTTHADSTTTFVGQPVTGDAVVYFYLSDDGTQLGAGPYLIPVARPYAVLSHFVADPAYETLNFLLVGPYPGEEEAAPPLLSGIPEGTELLGLEVADGMATVDLSAEFTADFDVLRRAVAQIVFTLTRLPDIQAVHFLVEGEPLLSPVRTGIPDPAARADFADLLPAVMIESPAYSASGGENPLRVHGVGITGVVGMELLDQVGAVLWQGTALTTSGPDWLGDFSVQIPYEVNEGQQGTLVAWEAAEDGSRTNVRRHPVWLNATPGATITTDPVAAQLALRYDLDKAINATLDELVEIDASLAGLGPNEGTDLRARATELDRYLYDLRGQLGRVYDELEQLGAYFDLPCSAGSLPSPLVDQPQLPAAVAELRTALYEAARACNWPVLHDLVADPAGFSYSFSESGDPVAYWQRMEFLHHRPMYYLAAILQQPFATVEGAESTIYAWPSAHAYGSWGAVPQAEREALRSLYDELDVASFEELGGYLGFRVGVSFDGDSAGWIYAISGD